MFFGTEGIVRQLPRCMGCLLLLAAMIIAFSGCSRCSSEKEATGPIVVGVEPETAQHIVPLLESLQKSGNASIKVVHFWPEDLGGQMKDGSFDLAIFSGADRLRQVTQQIGLDGPAIPWVADAVELIVRSDNPLIIDRPQHLLQEALSGPGFVPISPAGEMTHKLLNGWGLYTRLGNKLNSFANMERAIAAFESGRIHALFVRRTERLKMKGVALRLDLGKRPDNWLVTYLAVPKNASRKKAAHALAAKLLDPKIVKMLTSSGFVTNDKRPSMIVPRAIPPKTDGDADSESASKAATDLKADSKEKFPAKDKTAPADKEKAKPAAKPETKEEAKTDTKPEEKPAPKAEEEDPNLNRPQATPDGKPIRYK